MPAYKEDQVSKKDSILKDEQKHCKEVPKRRKSGWEVKILILNWVKFRVKSIKKTWRQFYKGWVYNEDLCAK